MKCNMIHDCVSLVIYLPSAARLGNRDVAPVARCSLGPENVKCMSRFWPPGPPAILAHLIFICYWA